MSLARVVKFEDVSGERIAELKRSIGEGERPEELPATEIVILHDAEGASALAILFFESEDDYRRGDEVMNAMPPDGTPGRRTSVAKYEVAVRRTG